MLHGQTLSHEFLKNRIVLQVDYGSIRHAEDASGSLAERNSPVDAQPAPPMRHLHASNPGHLCPNSGSALAPLRGVRHQEVTGTYRLKLRVSVPPTDHDDENQRFFRKELGGREVQVVVPAGDHTAPSLDLGPITIPVKQR